tara:strand:- start:20130 stop:20285 length:156 start_codon:yes stop_codon:yes gene_type:complete
MRRKCPRLTAAMILLGSSVHGNGFGFSFRDDRLIDATVPSGSTRPALKRRI